LEKPSARNETKNYRKQISRHIIVKKKGKHKVKLCVIKTILKLLKNKKALGFKKCNFSSRLGNSSLLESITLNRELKFHRQKSKNYHTDAVMQRNLLANSLIRELKITLECKNSHGNYKRICLKFSLLITVSVV